MKNNILVDLRLFFLTVHFFVPQGWGPYKGGKIPVQKLGDQRGEGAYFWENAVNVQLYARLTIKVTANSFMNN